MIQFLKQFNSLTFFKHIFKPRCWISLSSRWSCITFVLTVNRLRKRASMQVITNYLSINLTEQCERTVQVLSQW